MSFCSYYEVVRFMNVNVKKRLFMYFEVRSMSQGPLDKERNLIEGEFSSNLIRITHKRTIVGLKSVRKEQFIENDVNWSWISV